MGSFAPPPDFDDVMTLARTRLVMLDQALETLGGPGADDRRARLLDGLIDRLGGQQETT